jgi:hypothetical protein
MTAENLWERFWGRYGLLAIAAVVGFFVVKHYWGDAVPGAFFERGAEYEQSVYLSLYPEGSTVKNYHVKGDIWHHGDTYSLMKVYWPNGGYTTFSGCDNLSLDNKGLCMPTPPRTKPRGRRITSSLQRE